VHGFASSVGKKRGIFKPFFGNFLQNYGVAVQIYILLNPGHPHADTDSGDLKDVSWLPGP
jgi:hypothetical protein